MDVVQLVKDGKARFEYAEVVSERNNYKLYIKVFRDAMKFDEVPPLTWRRGLIAPEPKINGVRLPASAKEMQQIADMLGCMLLTPKVVDLIWLQAGIKFNCIYNIDGKIVANIPIHILHHRIESMFADDEESIISCVGKYWVLFNGLGVDADKKMYGKVTACNYGWFDDATGSGPCLSPGTRCWQRPGFHHNDGHLDPSQTIRLMHRMARLIHPDGTEEGVDLLNLAQDPELSFLMNHAGKLSYLRQYGIPELERIDIYDPKPAPEPEPEPEPVQPPLDATLPSEPPPPSKDKEVVVPVEEARKEGFFEALMKFIKKLLGGM